MRTWDRLESMARSIGLSGGLEARIADPLWMLARQRQVAEFRGDDAAQPAAVRVSSQHLNLATFQGSSGAAQVLPVTLPLEALVETTPGPDFGTAGLFAAVRASRRLIRLLSTAGLDPAVAALRTAFPLQAPDRQVTLGAASAQAITLFIRRGIDAAAMADSPPAQVQAILAAALAPAAARQAAAILAQWSAWYIRRDGETRSPAWNEERLEYTFSVSSAAGPGGSPPGVELEAPEHTGGHLDWYTFDCVAASPASGGPPPRSHTALPMPVRYQGMPAGRWWQFEDGAVNFGDLEAGPTDLARLLVAEFATIYSRDWFMIPIRVPVGTLSQVIDLEVIDNFGGKARILSTAANDAQRVSGPRAWHMFELSGDEVAPGHPAPWLFVPPTLAGDVNGPLLERVVLARDEGANLAWAIESQVEGVFGRAVDRAQAWHAAQSAAPPNAPDSSAAPQTYAGQAWRYQLETTPPGWWIPLLPERVAAGSAEVRFRRARMQAWDLYTQEPLASQVGPQGLYLDPRRPLWILEEEVPASGVRLERRWQFCRWQDGSFHVWLQRRKSSGRGERSSGLRFDLLLP